MTIKRINEFPEGSGSLTNDDIFLFMDDPSNGGITKKISLSQIGASIGGGGIAAHAHDDRYYTESEVDTFLAGKQVSGSYATLVNGTIPSSQLPSYVDDVVEAANLAALPATGETGKIYVALDTNKTYRWSGSTYIEISAAPGSTDSVPEGSVNKYYTDARASAAAPVQSVAGKTGIVSLGKSDVGLNNVDNTSDANKPVSTATQTALDGKANTSHAHLTGRTIFVDALTGTDTRTGLSQYDMARPFATIGAAVAASATTDTVYVRSGSYTITSQISLDGKGNIWFDMNTTVNVAGTVVAFSLTANEIKAIQGRADFVVLNTAGIMSQSAGNLLFHFRTISGHTTLSTGTLFSLSGGLLDVKFDYINAAGNDAFVVTGSGQLVVRESFAATVKQFLNCNTTGGITIDIWTIVGQGTGAVLHIVRHLGFSYRGVNLLSANFGNSGCAVRFAYPETLTGIMPPIFRQGKIQTYGSSAPIVCEKNFSSWPAIWFDQIKIIAATATASISATQAVTIFSTTTYSNKPVGSNVTVTGQYIEMEALNSYGQ